MSLINQPERLGLESVSESSLQQIGKRIDSALSTEVFLARSKAQLYLQPETSSPVLDLERPQEWQKYLSDTSNPVHDREISLKYRNHPRSTLELRATFPALINGDWNCSYIHKEGNDLPITIDKSFGNLTLQPFIGELSDEQLIELTLLFSKLYSGETETSEAREKITAEQAVTRFSQKFTLAEFLEDPEGFFASFRSEDLVVVPNRLMTRDEVRNYVSQTSDFLKTQAKSNRKLIVGEPGYGSYREVQALFSDQFADPEINPLGVSLKFRDLHPDGTTVDPSHFVMHSPIAIQDEGRTLGWTIYQNYLGAKKPNGDSWEFARFGHGNFDLFCLNRI